MDSSSNTGHIIAEGVGEYGETIVLVRPDRTISRDEFGGTLTLKSVEIVNPLIRTRRLDSLVGRRIDLPGDDDLLLG